MNTSKLADIAEITSSIAILVTLVFLVMQMQQNTDALRANGLQAAVAQELQQLYVVANNPELIMNRTAIDLTDEEKLQTGIYLLAFFRQREHDWLQFQKGYLDAETWKTYSRPIPVALSSQRARGWWRDASPIIFNPNFVAEINEMIADIPVDEQAVQAVWAD